MSIVEHEQQVVEKSVELDYEAQALLRAAELVRESWGQGYSWERPMGTRCAVQAIYEAGGTPSRFYWSLGQEITTWNDRPGRTAEEVATALERAAYGL